MQMLNENFDIAIARVRDSNVVAMLQIVGGEPDACGHRFVVDVTRNRDGSYLVQTNFNDVFESRHRLEDALGFALSIAAQIDLDGFGPRGEDA